MRRAAVAAKVSPAPSPLPVEAVPVAEPMRRTGSGGGASGVYSGNVRAPSSLSIRKVDSPVNRPDSTRPDTPVRTGSRPTPIRTPPSNTAGSTSGTPRNLGSSVVARQVQRTGAGDLQRRRLSSLPITTTAADLESVPLSPEPAETSQPGSPSPSASSSSSNSSPAQSRIIRRPPRFRGNDQTTSFIDDDDDEEDELAFRMYQPQTAGSSSAGQTHDMSATLRGDQKRLPKHSARDNHRLHRSHHSDSSSSSAAAFRAGPGGPLSPRRTMELTGQSSGVKGKGLSRDSDGTPSMGSSFSDLDGM